MHKAPAFAQAASASEGRSASGEIFSLSVQDFENFGVYDCEAEFRDVIKELKILMRWKNGVEEVD